MSQEGHKISEMGNIEKSIIKQSLQAVTFLFSDEDLENWRNYEEMLPIRNREIRGLPPKAEDNKFFSRIHCKLC